MATKQKPRIFDPLTLPSDATSEQIEEALKQSGYEVTDGSNMTLQEIEKALLEDENTCELCGDPAILSAIDIKMCSDCHHSFHAFKSNN
ncbi:MAG: hypothetical protein IH840_08990 [Candidatus Heimdallarchaeota archaeon]|nr:hypothetical protein [Candidatus Heimdallarchaeota archaeon]